MAYSSGASHRIKQLNEVIKEELGRILIEELEQKPGLLVTITEVATSKDLLAANVLVSVYPMEETQRVFEELEGRAGWFQHLLNRQLGMRPVPGIRFVFDKRVSEADRIEQLIEETKKKEK